jgi:glycosyltransferase involved in cell wall biosynthesis
MATEKNVYPKVLVIGSNCFSTQKNNGKTFVSYFNGYPVDKIAQLYIWPEFPDSNICNNYYRITDMDMLRALIANDDNCGQKVEMRYNQEDVNISPVFGKGFTQWHSARIARELIWLKKSWKTKAFINWVEEFSPDVILFYGIGNPCLFRIADFLCKNYNLPIIVSITDDYYLPRISLSPFYHIRRLWLVHWMKKILNTNKSELITINQFMKEKYKEVFCKDSSIVMNCVTVQKLAHSIMITIKSL